MQKVHTNIVKKGLCLGKQISNLDSKYKTLVKFKLINKYKILKMP
jgi:hypothetical protein